MVDKLDEDTKAILEVLGRYPEGITINKLYENLKDSRGRYLMSKPTFQKKLQILKSEKLVVEEVEGEWKRGKKKIIKLKDCYRIIAKKLSEIRAYVDLFRKYIVRFCIPILIHDDINGYNKFYQKLAAAQFFLLQELEEKKYEIFESDISKDFKKILLFEVFEVEKEIKNIFLNAIFEKEEEDKRSPSLHLRRFIRTYPKLRETRSELEKLKNEMIK